MKNPLLSSHLLLSPGRSQPARHYLAGYLLNYRAALKLYSAVTGSPIPPDKKDYYHYPFPTPTEESIMEYFRKKRLRSGIRVQFTGDKDPPNTIIVTQENFKFRGPLSKVVERGKEKAVREWLEAKGISKDEYRWEIELR